jgi:hypothetical protein
VKDLFQILGLFRESLTIHSDELFGAPQGELQAAPKLKLSTESLVTVGYKENIFISERG